MLTLALGAFWEIMEFASDQILATSYQHGLDDTMWDLITDLVGGGIIGVLGNIYVTQIPEERFFRKKLLRQNEK